MLTDFDKITEEYKKLVASNELINAYEKQIKYYHWTVRIGFIIMGLIIIALIFGK